MAPMYLDPTGVGRFRMPGLRYGTVSSGSATLRQIATRTRVPSTKDTARQQLMSRTGHHNRAGQAVSALRIGIPNWNCNTGGTGEQGSGGTSTITASIEYPAGTYTQVTFGGAITGTTATNTTLMSDTMTLAQSIPDDALFWVNTYVTNPTAIVYTYKFRAEYGDKGRYGASGVADSTMASFAGNVNVTLPPCLILGQGTKPATLVLGDSRVYGTGGTAAETGEIEPSLHPTRPYINAGIFGANASQATTGRRQEMASYCDNIIFQLGINDINGGTPLSTYQGVVANMRGRSGFSGKKMVLTTKLPKTTSSDGWATTANQTADQYSPTRTAVNDWIRTDPYGEGYFEIADVLESARNSGFWKADGTVYTGDGIHENDAGYEAIRASGAVNLALLG